MLDIMGCSPKLSQKGELAVIGYCSRLSSLRCLLYAFSCFVSFPFSPLNKFFSLQWTTTNETGLNMTLIWPLISLLFSRSVKLFPQYPHPSSRCANTSFYPPPRVLDLSWIISNTVFGVSGIIRNHSLEKIPLVCVKTYSEKTLQLRYEFTLPPIHFARVETEVKRSVTGQDWSFSSSKAWVVSARAFHQLSTSEKYYNLLGESNKNI